LAFFIFCVVFFSGEKIQSKFFDFFVQQKKMHAKKLLVLNKRALCFDYFLAKQKKTKKYKKIFIHKNKSSFCLTVYCL